VLRLYLYILFWSYFSTSSDFFDPSIAVMLYIDHKCMIYMKKMNDFKAYVPFKAISGHV